MTKTLTTWMALAALAAGGCKKQKEDGGEQAAKDTPPPAAPADAAPAAPETPKPVRIEGVELATPESAYYDDDFDQVLVSNINGTPFEADDNGFISKVTPDGKIAELKWIDGAAEKVTLNAPKGMAISSGTLYVADVNVVRKFDAVTGAPKGEVKVKGATFLNDVVAHGGVVYVSDSGLKAGEEGFEPSGTDAVYAIDSKDKITKILSGDELGRPNGLAVVGDELYMVGFGNKELSRIDPAGKKREVVAELPHGANDGLVATRDGRLVVSSWECQCLVAGPPSGPFEVVARDLKSPADIGWDSKRERAIVPHFEESALSFVPLVPGGAAADGAAPAGGGEAGEDKAGGGEAAGEDEGGGGEAAGEDKAAPGDAPAGGE